jgi:hypothetical protein
MMREMEGEGTLKAGKFPYFHEKANAWGRQNGEMNKNECWILSNGRLPRAAETALRFLLGFRGVVDSMFSTSLSSSVPAKIFGMGTDSWKPAAANWI